MKSILDSIEEWWGITADGIQLAHSQRPSEMLELLIASQDIRERGRAPWEYKSLADMAKEDVVGGGIDGPQDAKANVFGLIASVAESYGMHLRAFRHYVPEGLRLYVRDESGFREGTDIDADWQYFRLTIEQDENISVSVYESPSWAKNLYLNRDNYRIWRAIYCDMPRTSDPDYLFTKRSKRVAVDLLTSGNAVALPLKKIGSLPHELRAAIDAFEAVHGNAQATAKCSARAALMRWLESNRPELSINARDRIATLANWQPSGGAPKTPCE